MYAKCEVNLSINRFELILVRKIPIYLDVCKTFENNTYYFKFAVTFGWVFEIWISVSSKLSINWRIFRRVDKFMLYMVTA